MSDSRTSIHSLPHLTSAPGEPFELSLRRAAEWLAATPITPSLFVAGSIATATLLVGGSPRASAILMVVAVTYASYGLDRIVDRAAASRAGSSLALALTSLSFFAASLALAFVNGGLPLAACAFFFPLSVAAYCLPWLGFIPALRTRGILRVKDIPYTKNLYTSLCVALGGLWAARASGIAHPKQLWTVLGIMFLVNLINTAACDLGDVEADRRDGVPTFAVRFGRRATSQMLRGLSWTIYGLIAVAAAVGLLAPIGLLVALGALPIDAYLRVLGKDSASDLVADLAPDLTDAGIGLFAFILSMLVGG